MSIIFPKDKEKGDINSFTLTVLLIGLFGGLGIVFYIGGQTFILVDTVFNIAFLAGLLFFLVHLPFLKRLNRYLVEIVLYCFFGWGLLVCATFLGLNFLIHSKPVTDQYPVKGFEMYRAEHLPYPVAITLDKPIAPGAVDTSAYLDFAYMLKFESEDELKYSEKPQIAIMTTAQGVFGYRILLHKEVR